MIDLAQRVASRFSIAYRVALRYRSKLAADLGVDEFAKELESHLKLDGRQIRIDTKGFAGSRQTVYVSFVNLPHGVGSAGGGAEAMNNRMVFSVEGFSKEGGPPPAGKVKVQLTASSLPSEYRLRAKSGPPNAVVKYLADFINKVVKEVPPKYTHTQQP